MFMSWFRPLGPSVSVLQCKCNTVCTKSDICGFICAQVLSTLFLPEEDCPFVLVAEGAFPSADHSKLESDSSSKFLVDTTGAAVMGHFEDSGLNPPGIFTLLV